MGTVWGRAPSIRFSTGWKLRGYFARRLPAEAEGLVGSTQLLPLAVKLSKKVMRKCASCCTRWMKTSSQL